MGNRPTSKERTTVDSQVTRAVGGGKRAMRIMLMALLVAGAAAVSLSAWAQGHGRHGGHRCGCGRRAFLGRDQP